MCVLFLSLGARSTGGVFTEPVADNDLFMIMTINVIFKNIRCVRQVA